MTHAVTLTPRKLRSPGRPRNRRVTANNLSTRACHRARPIRTASSPPSDPSNRTINTLRSSANPPAAPANPSLALPTHRALLFHGPEAAAFACRKSPSRLDLDPNYFGLSTLISSGSILFRLRRRGTVNLLSSVGVSIRNAWVCFVMCRFHPIN